MFPEDNCSLTARLKLVEGKLLACYVQPGVMHGVYGTEGRKLRDIAERLFYSKFL